MNHRTLYRLAAITLVSVLCGLSAGLPVQGGAAATTTITARVPVGQEVLVAVKTNPSTGYHWEVRPVAGIKVSYMDFPTRKVGPQHPLVGVPVIRIYQLTALKARTTPYVVRLVERTPAGQASGATVVVTISTLP